MTREEFKKLPENTELSVDCNAFTMFAYEGYIVNPDEDDNVWYKVDDETIGFTGSHKCSPHFKDAVFFFDETEIIKN